jgi:hypothetical protein
MVLADVVVSGSLFQSVVVLGKKEVNQQPTRISTVLFLSKNHH